MMAAEGVGLHAAGQVVERVAHIFGGQVAAAINAKTAQTGVTATFNTTTGAVALTAADGRNIDIVLGAAGTGGCEAAVLMD